MSSRHLETSEAAQPEHLRRPVGEIGDFEAMIASNPRIASEEMLCTPEEAAVGVIESVLAGERYIVTHGDLAHVLAARHAALIRAAESGR